VHYMMGGVGTDTNGETPIKGLYAAGEAACISLNGANRLGSNSLGELLVFGARAGAHAAEYAPAQREASTAILAQAHDEEKRIEREFLNRNGGSERIAVIREEMQHAMEIGAGIYRTRDSLEATAAKLHELRERNSRITLDDHHRTFNTQLLSAFELSFMLDVAEAIIHAGLSRTESRGAHQRTEFPNRDDEKFLAQSMVHRNVEGPPRVTFAPVTITRWPPGERVYGR
ncbi:MAG: FAD-binding protein, partial [Candidatus Binataceae bacterium]